MKFALIILCCAAIAGCAPGSGNDGATKKKSTMQTAVDGFTGKTAVQAGQKARADIERISAEKNADLDAVMGN